MSGLQEIAAIIGIAELSIRSISLLYEFVSDLQHVPQEIETIRDEIHILSQSLSALGAVASANSEARAIIQRIGLPFAIQHCGEACKKLMTELSKWLQVSGKPTIRTRVHFRLNKKTIDGLLAQISFAKQTAILSIVTTQLYVQLETPMSDAQREATFAKAEKQLSEYEGPRKPSRFSRPSVDGPQYPPEQARMEVETVRAREVERVRLRVANPRSGYGASTETIPGSGSQDTSNADSRGETFQTNGQPRSAARQDKLNQKFSNIEADDSTKNSFGNFLKNTDVEQEISGLKLKGNSVNVFASQMSSSTGWPHS